MLANLTILDLSIVVAYFGIVLAIGFWSAGKRSDSDDFINGSRQMPWWAVLGSLVATEVSASTFLATPGVGFSENMNYLQMGIGSFFARIFIALIFLGAFYSFNALTIYEYLANRFGSRTRTTASIFFIITRLLASSVRLMIAATGIGLILDLPFTLCLFVFTLIAMLYTGSGGIRSVIWTDVLQAIVFISCGLVVILYIANSIGLDTILSTGAEAGRFEVFKLSPQTDSGGVLAWLNDGQLLYIAMLFGFLSTAAAFGTDQDLTQRMLTCKNVTAARRSVVLSGFVSLPLAALFLFVGVALFAYTQSFAPTDLPLRDDGSIRADHILPWFIGNELPSGLRGLLLVGALAAAMSSLDSAMGALGSSALVDLYRPLVAKGSLGAVPELWITRLFVVIFGLLLALGAWSLRNAEGFLWLTFQIGSITYGGLLGVFLLGILTKRGCDSGNLIALLSGAAICTGLLIAIRSGQLSLGWTWLIFIGTSWTFTLGAVWPKKSDTGTNQYV
ncbi:sodium:solute symporter family transporter [Coraliomargarita akajimensis]|uniref:SSS sodium solute transporter superfamily n=1 Tax=Coraliomargarita akajimensis (strain DSM 45221 / IAM 15411 / JCM 23193 / KCTC 12865 / 04OKA010-24) TaxID=583355 RepID=D5EQB2_CORAD|nr:sodium/solute symporter [Coraliomargarita akajimensis]ADE53880.1 SSS sodium solute transporter superfamily [Coraliomargarita akajimensis DSM 45221]